MEKDLSGQYGRRAGQFKARAEALGRRYNQLALLRLVLFVAGAGFAIFLWAEYWPAGLGFSLFFLLGFVFFVRRHQRIRQEQYHQETLAAVNEREQRSLALDFADAYPGDEFADLRHPYAMDLDIFGRHSLFQYLNRGNTTVGRKRLAEWLSEPAPAEAIAIRQAAAAELAPLLDWRQHLQAHGARCEEAPGDLDLLLGWLKTEPFVRPNRGLVVSLYVAPFWGMTALLLTLLVVPWQFGLLLFLPPAFLLRRTLSRVNETHQQTSRAGEALGHYARIIEHIESQAFSSPQLARIRDDFAPGPGRKASDDLRRLAYIINQLNVRYNIFAVVLNVLGLWDLQWVYRLEKWKAEHRDRLPAWFAGLADMEALLSLATLKYNNPDWTFPEMVKENTLTAVRLGHPLIHHSRRVANDLQMPVRGHIKLITGSNMAGKSTFLRTVGMNIALAMAGAPVCAQSLQLPFLRVYTSMRTQDALHESTSSFYAELKRLKFIIEAVEAGEPIFFLLDEILKGTNSRDRHTGSKALIRQLIRFRGAGLIATHDLELGALETEAGGAIENLCLEVAIREGELYFDYRLKQGVSQSFNATLLMQKMGIRIDEAEEENGRKEEQ